MTGITNISDLNEANRSFWQKQLARFDELLSKRHLVVIAARSEERKALALRGGLSKPRVPSQLLQTTAAQAL